MSETTVFNPAEKAPFTVEESLFHIPYGSESNEHVSNFGSAAQGMGAEALRLAGLEAEARAEHEGRIDVVDDDGPAEQIEVRQSSKEDFELAA